MEKLFIPYALAFILKEKGFNEPCLAFYDSFDNQLHTWRVPDGLVKNSDVPDSIATPTYQQVVDWLRTNHGLYVNVSPCIEENDSEFYLSASVFKLFEVTPLRVGWNNITIPEIFHDYDKALLAALEEAIKRIKK